MPKRHHPDVERAIGLANGVEAVDAFLADESLTTTQRRSIIALAWYEMRCQQARPPQRRARRLLWQFLDDEQRHQLRHRHSFTFKAGSGSCYRFWPQAGTVERLEQHGCRAYAMTSYCIHDYPRELPPADLTLAQLLMLIEDEDGFLATANAHPREMLGWSRAWQTRRRALPDGAALEDVRFCVIGEAA